MADVREIEYWVTLYVIAQGAVAKLRQAENEIPGQLMGELRSQRLKKHVDDFISAFREAARAAKATWGERLAGVEATANSLKGPMTASEAETALKDLRVWLETRDV